MLLDRIAGFVLLLVGLATMLLALDFYIPYQYEPVGPKALPLLVAIVLAATGSILCLKPQPQQVRFNSRQVWLAVVLFSYAMMYEPLGFMVSTFIVVAALAKICQAGHVVTLGSAALFSVVGYVLLGQVLGLQLPAVWWWG